MQAYWTPHMNNDDEAIIYIVDGKSLLFLLKPFNVSAVVYSSP